MKKENILNNFSRKGANLKLCPRCGNNPDVVLIKFLRDEDFETGHYFDSKLKYITQCSNCKNNDVQIQTDYCNSSTEAIEKWNNEKIIIQDYMKEAV